jgi:sulfide:quinone oxidoreductase
VSATGGTSSLEVVVVGGGVAGLETVLALRALAGDRVRISLLTPESEFVYRPLAVGEPYELGGVRRHPLDEIARNLQVELVAGELDWVAPCSGNVLTRDGTEIPYDALVLATGARALPAWSDVLTFNGPGDTPAIQALAGEVESGKVESVAFVAPSGVSWPLPLYELALTTAARAEEAGRRPELVLVTPEREPLAVFGAEASHELSTRLESRGVRLMRSAAPEVRDGDMVVPAPGESAMSFDRIVAVPRLIGTAPTGVPHDEHGFVPIDTHGVVYGIDHVYAAGDGTDFPVKQGGIASHQAGAVAEVIAKRAGADSDPQPFRGALRSQLLTSAEPRFLRTNLSLDAIEQPQEPVTPPWWPATKIAGPYLAPYLAARITDGNGNGNGDHMPRRVFLPGDLEHDPWGE